MSNDNEEALAQEMVAQVASILRRNAAQAEAEKKLIPETADLLKDSGLLRSWIPRVYGGLEMTPHVALAMFEDVAHIDGAAGWVLANSAGISTMGTVFPEEGCEERYSDPKTMFAGAWFPPGTAEPVQGGYKVSGRWSFGSGCHYATWLTGQALITENGVPRLGPNGAPTPMIVFFPADEAQISDNWNTLGMRGTGSHDIAVQDIFVPKRQCWQVGPWQAKNDAFSGPTYGLGLWIVAPVNASVALGIARAAIDGLLELASKTPSYTQTGLSDRQVVQDRLARAQALVGAAHSYIQTSVKAAYDFVAGGGKMSIEQGTPVALAGSFAIDAAVQAVDLVHACAGTSAIREEQRFQQYFRDVHTISQHAFSSLNRYESLGKLMLGKETDWAFYYL